MASGLIATGTAWTIFACLNSCSGEVWPRGPRACGRPRPRGRCLNSCSGEVWPRGRSVVRSGASDDQVSILVLVKYGLGARISAGAGQRARGVSILVLVKYGLGGRHGDRRLRLGERVSILVLVKYGLGDLRLHNLPMAAQSSGSQFLFW